MAAGIDDGSAAIAPVARGARPALSAQPISRVVVSLPRPTAADVAQDFVTGQRAHRSVDVGELGVEQFGHEVVGRMIDAPVDSVARSVRFSSPS